MRRLSARNSLPVFLVMYLAKNDIIVSLLDALSHVTKPICAMMSETCSFEQLFEILYAQFRAVQQSWREHHPIFYHCVHCWVSWNPTVHSGPPKSLYPVLLSSDLWRRNMHQHLKPAKHHRSNWFAPSRHHSAQDVNEVNHWDKKKFPRSNDLWALLAAIWTYQ